MPNLLLSVEACLLVSALFLEKRTAELTNQVLHMKERKEMAHYLICPLLLARSFVVQESSDSSSICMQNKIHG